MNGQIIHQDANVLISNSRASIFGKTYAMSSITSVEMRCIPKKIASKIFVITISLLFVLLFGLFALGSRTDGSVIYIVLVIIFAIPGIVSAIGMIRERGRFIMLIRSSSGEDQALSSFDGGYVALLVDKVNRAIVLRG